MPNKVERISGIPVHCWSQEDVLIEIDRNIQETRATEYICITNTESMYHARRLPSHKEYIENARFSLCDGIGVVIGAGFQGKRVWRFNGPQLMLMCCEYGKKRQWSHFFYGGNPGVADLLSQRLTDKFPTLITAGTLSPPFRALTHDEEEEIIQKINDSSPDILWVGLGLLKQEGWISRNISRLRVPWVVGVGAAFDFHAGTARWAPSIIRKSGMEWLYRLLHEPRMFKRNIYSLIYLFWAVSEPVFGRLHRFWRRN